MIAFRSVGAGRTGDVRLRSVIVLTLIAVLSSLPHAWAQDPDKNPADKKLGWTNSSDFSLVITSGNSATQTLGLSDQLRH